MFINLTLTCYVIVYAKVKCEELLKYRIKLIVSKFGFASWNEMGTDEGQK